MPYQSDSLPTTFTALSDPTRMAVIQMLATGPASVSQLSQSFDMALPSFTQHLGVLEKAGLILSHREGRKRICALNPSALKQAEDWLSAYRQQWEARFDRYEAHLQSIKNEDDNA